MEFLADGQRVELNAMDSAQFIAWLERKLIPPLAGAAQTVLDGVEYSVTARTGKENHAQMILHIPAFTSALGGDTGGFIVPRRDQKDRARLAQTVADERYSEVELRVDALRSLYGSSSPAGPLLNTVTYRLPVLECDEGWGR
ncbi:MAG: hypothetical protein ACR2HX_25105 [Pyrinomonadaceae bacterium]